MGFWRGVFLAAAIVAMPVAAAAQGKPSAAAEQTIGSISDTQWQGEFAWDGEAARTWTIWFRPDGVMIYSYGGATYDNGRWGERDALVWMDTNQHYALFVGHKVGGAIEGASYNKEGLTGAWRITPQ